MGYAHDTVQSIDAGDSPDAIVCLHGWCCRTGDFADQVDSNSDRFRLLVPDWQRRLSRRDGSCSFEGICRDIIGCIEAAGISRPLLVGHSLGGFLATQIVFEHQLPVRGLLVLDSALPLPEAYRVQWSRAADRLEQGPYVQACTDFVEPFFVDAERGPLEQSIVEGMVGQPPGTAIGLLREICRHEWDHELDRIDTPVHMVASGRGALDMKAFHAHVPDATSERIEESGHFITVFHPDRVGQTMRRMMR
ncbi:MAG: hypothetical protein CMJ24_05925 [Phycisphaerae bacterium]|nr:hypothetical protein [Phycisphaerae bacterium]MDG1899899.1 alpha/beta hydrolase [Phycisphaerales bacterium]